MSKKRKFIDPNQKEFDFDAKVEAYQEAKEQILEACHAKQPVRHKESYREACIEVAAAIKRAIRRTHMSREEVVDAINQYFGDTKIPLSIHIFNHYLSKPVDYPLPAYYLFPILKITGSLAPLAVFAEAEDARVISGAEVRQMALGKLDETITEMQRLKKELKGKI